MRVRTPRSRSRTTTQATNTIILPMAMVSSGCQELVEVISDIHDQDGERIRREQGVERAGVEGRVNEIDEQVEQRQPAKQDEQKAVSPNGGRYRALKEAGARKPRAASSSPESSRMR